MTRFFLIAVAAVFVIALAYQVPFVYHVEVGGNDSAYLDGFYGPEVGSNLNWRWSENAARIVFHNAGQIIPQARLRINLNGYRPEELPPAHVSLALNSQPLADFQAPREFVVKEFDVDVDHAGAGDWIFGLSSETFRPQNDSRLLGLQVDWAELVPASPLQIPPLQTLLLALISSIAFFSVVRFKIAERKALALTFGFVLALGVALALAREWVVLGLPALALALTSIAVFLVLSQSNRFQALRLFPGRSQSDSIQVFMGFALALLGQVLLSLGFNAGVDVILLLLGTVTIFAGGVSSRHEDAGARGMLSRTELLSVASLIALALFFRLYRLDQVPFAIFRDEARHGLTALRILSDPNFRPLFLGPPINQPTPFFYVLAGVFQAIGVSIFSLRLFSALAGALTVPLLWLLVREFFDARVAFVAAFGLAISSWHTTISRFAVPYVEPTLFALSAYFLLWRGFKNGKLLYFATAGLLIALGQYSSHTAKALFIVAAALVVDQLTSSVAARDWMVVRRTACGTLLASVLGLIALAPLMNYIVTNPDEYFARANQVAIWNPVYANGEYLVSMVGENIVKYLGAFNVVGDPNGRHHLPFAPFLDPIFGILFVVGTLVVLKNLRAREYRSVLYWFAAGLIAGITTVDAPSAERTIEAAPTVYVVAALGAIALWDTIGALELRVSRRVIVAGACILLIAALAYNFTTYFVRMYDSPSVWRKMGPVAARLGETLTTLNQNGTLPRRTVVYVPREFLESSDDPFVLQFLIGERFSVRGFDDADPPSLSARGVTAFVLPNYSDFWRLVTTVEPRYVNEATKAAQDDARRRAGLAPFIPRSIAITGTNFPDSDAPTFWLYIVR